MKSLTLAATSALALCAATAASAADLPQAADPYVPPPAQADYDWTGLYAGLNVGVAFLKERMRAFPDVPGVPFSARESDSSLTYGGQVGYNHQIDALVLGVEGDFNFLDAGSDLTFTGTNTTTWKSDYDWFATIRGRVGFAADNTLFYATGGVAWLHGEFDIATAGGGGGVGAPAPIVGAAASDKDTLLGYTIGGGIEHAFSEAFSGKVEYLYADFESHTLSDGLATVKTRPDLHVLRIGLNYHF
jgi:outer membrane immunogenic protein